MRHLNKLIVALLLRRRRAGGTAIHGRQQDGGAGRLPQWVFLTSSLDLNYNTAATPSHHMLDNVFVDPEAYQAFREDRHLAGQDHPDQGKPHGRIRRHPQQGGPVPDRGDEPGNPRQGRGALSQRQMGVLCFTGRQGGGRR